VALWRKMTCILRHPMGLRHPAYVCRLSCLYVWLIYVLSDTARWSNAVQHIHAGMSKCLYTGLACLYVYIWGCFLVLWTPHATTLSGKVSCLIFIGHFPQKGQPRMIEVAKTHRMPYLHRSFSTKEPWN